MKHEAGSQPWQARLFTVIFGTETPAGKRFDVILLWCIVVSVLLVMAESVASVRERFGKGLLIAEYVFTGFFTIEYVLRLLIVKRPMRYATSYFGVVDLLSILPTYLAVFLGGAHSLMIIRALRLLRVFRILKLTRYMNEAGVLRRALIGGRRKIIVFLFAILAITTIFGTVMYLVEGQEAGFTSIPTSIYWAIVTLTTVGYGDIAPVTPLGQAISALIMVLGYAMIAVPTGIVGAEMARQDTQRAPCGSCGTAGHLADARFCRNCGKPL